jgi:hypothetical protein
MTSLSGIKVCENCFKKYAPKTTWQVFCTKECFHLHKAKEAKVKENAKSKSKD